MSEKLERREFLKPLNIQSLYTEQRIDALKRLISDVNDANLYGLSQLEERIDALERRIEAMERKLNHKGGGE